MLAIPFPTCVEAQPKRSHYVDYCALQSWLGNGKRADFQDLSTSWLAVEKCPPPPQSPSCVVGRVGRPSTIMHWVLL